MSTITKPVVTGTPLDALREMVADGLASVDQLIYNLIKSQVELIPEISEHTISSGGKRLRPMLTLAAAQMCGYRGVSHIDLAASVEFIHTATLLHDDVVDKSDMRRGASTANELWGNKESILVGDFLLGKAFELMGTANSLDVYRVLSRASVVIAEGEVRQLAVTGKLDISEEEYFAVINAKTAELFAAACEIGAIVAGRPEAEAKALREYGMKLGIAFQLVDDALDYSAKQENLGKKIGDDFREKKVTMPVIIAYSQAVGKDKQFWESAFSGEENNEASLKTAIALINKTESIPATLKKARKIAAEAANALGAFPPSHLREVLFDVLGFVVERGY